MYSTIEFIENAINKLGKQAKILVHCYKVYLATDTLIGQLTVSNSGGSLLHLEARLHSELGAGVHPKQQEGHRPQHWVHWTADELQGEADESEA